MPLDDDTLKRLDALKIERAALAEARLFRKRNGIPYHLRDKSPLIRKKEKARNLSQLALKQGKILRAISCENPQCNSPDELQMHHEDYDKPLEVTWFCRNCHVKLHAGLRNV